MIFDINEEYYENVIYGIFLSLLYVNWKVK